MPNTKDLAENAYPSILIVGEPGTHKTYISGYFPKPYFFDFDKGLAIHRGKAGIDYDTFKEAPKDSKVFNPAKGIYQFGKGWPAFLERLNEIGAAIDAGTCPYETIVFDSLTMMGNVALNHVLAGAMKDGRYKWGDPVDQGLWGWQSRLLEMVMDQLTAWDIIKIVIAHVQRDTNTVTMNVERLPLTTGKFAGKVGAYFNDVWYTDVGNNDKLVVRTAPGKMLRQAKSQLNVPDGTELEWAKLEKYVLGTRVPAGK